MRRFSKIFTTFEYGWILFLSILLTVLFTFPALPQISHQFIGDGYDNYEYAAYAGLAAKEIAAGHFPFTHSTFWRYPVGFGFARGFDSYLTVTLGAFNTLLLGIPLGYNVSILFLLALNGLCSYVFFKQLTRSPTLGILGMIMYGFSFYSLAKLTSHPNLMFTGGLSLVFAALIAIWRETKPTKNQIFLLCLGIILTALGSELYFLILGVFGILAAGLLALFSQEKFYEMLTKLTLPKQGFFPLYTGTLGVIILFYFPQLIALFTNQFVFFSRKESLDALTPAVSDYFLPNKYLSVLSSLVGTSTSLPSIEKVVFLGWIESVLFIGFLVSKIRLRNKLYLVSLVLIPLLLSFGYGHDNHFFLLPYHFLVNIFPFSLLVETGRYEILYALFLAAGGLLFLKSLPKNIGYALLLSSVIFLILLERIPLSLHQSDAYSTNAYISVVKQQTTNAVVDIPLSLFDPRVDLLSLRYDKPNVNGYFHWSADGEREKSFLVDTQLIYRYSCSDIDPILKNYNPQYEKEKDDLMLSALKKEGIHTLVIHKDAKFYFPECKNVRLRLNRLLSQDTQLVPTPLDKELNITQTLWETAPSFTFLLPQKGTVYLDGMYIAPSMPADFTILQDGKPTKLKYTWDNNPKDNSLQLTPKYKLTLPVASSSALTIQSTQSVPTTYFSFWYRYTTASQSATMNTTPLHKLFEDESAIVISL